MPGEGGEKTEKASQRKREDERKKGNVFLSKDVVVVTSLVVSFFAISKFAGSFYRQITLRFQNQFNRAAQLETMGVEEVMAIGREAAVLIATTLLPAMMIIGLVGVLATLFQTRFLVSGEHIKFKGERLSPIKGFQRMFSLRSLVELLKSLIKIVVLTWLLYGNVKKTIALLPSVIDWDILQAAGFVGKEITSLVISTAIAFGAVAGADYLYQWYEYEKSIRMTKQEVKDEYKRMEGNPEVKGARRQKQREYAQRRMISQVKDADVVVRNPTHFAVALKYAIDKDPAPLVLAKGADRLALKIVEEAEKNGVATVENKPLARSLYELAELDQLIPPELYGPVAELLAWLFNQRAGLK